VFRSGRCMRYQMTRGGETPRGGMRPLPFATVGQT